MSTSPQQHTVAIIGAGTVGKALARAVHSRGAHVCVYDTDPFACTPEAILHDNNNDDSTDSTDNTTNASPTLVAALSVSHAAAHAHLMLLTLPTRATDTGYDMQPFHDTLTVLQHQRFRHPVVVCSTVTPSSTDTLQAQYPRLTLFHLPEFLSSRTADVDVQHPMQDTVLLGVPDGCAAAWVDRTRVLVSRYLCAPHQRVVTVRARETECCKLFCNAFYAAKVQLFNEFYQLCTREGVAYPMVRQLMLRQGWVHPMHTQVPGADGSFGYGGACLPKDVKALVGWGRLEDGVLGRVLDGGEER